MTAVSARVDGRTVARTRNRRNLLDAAAELFAQRGYRGTTTRDIAEAAGITERTLFRHFDTKADIFRAAVITPVEAFVAEFASGWRQRDRGSRATDVEVAEFYRNLLDAVESERNLLAAVMAGLVTVPGSAAADGDVDEFPELRSMFTPLFEALEQIFAVEAQLRGWTLDPAITVRAIVGTAITMTIHREFLFAGSDVPSPDEVVDQLTRLTSWGLLGREPH